MSRCLLMLFVLLVLSCNYSNFNEKKSNSNGEIYDFVNFILNDKENKLNCKFMYDNDGWFSMGETDSIKLSGMINYFSKSDIDTIFYQYRNLKRLKFEQQYVSKTIVSYDTLQIVGDIKKFYEKIGAKYTVDGILTMSVPFFSIDRKTVLVKFGLANGSWGFDNFNIYKMENGHWVLKEKLNWSIS